MCAIFYLEKDEPIDVLIGQAGTSRLRGSGGTFVTAGENPVPLVIAGGAGADYMGRSSDHCQSALTHCSFNDGGGFTNSKSGDVLLLDGCSQKS